VDYPVQLSSQLQQLLKSLRKSRRMTQAELARRLGVVQSRVADIERDPGAVSVEQLLQVLAMLGAQMVVRETTTEASATRTSIDPAAHAQAKATATATLTTGSKPEVPTPGTQQDYPPDDEPRGQW
jgi:HTH-type transcriptional regulator/antitoxin HipB